MRTSCREFRRQMLEAHPLEAGEFARFDDHRESCAECATAFRAVDPLGLFSALAEDRPSPEIAAALEAGLREGIARADRRSRRTAVGLGVAAALVLMAGVTALGILPGPEAGSSREVGGPATLEPMAQIQAPTVESIDSPDARVYEMKVFGEGDRVTQLVLIFDEGIEL
jgi:hypothetical protein